MRNQPIKFLAMLSVGLSITACKPKAPDDSGIRYVAPKDGLNMRDMPSVTGRKLLTIPRGAQVQKLEEKPDSFTIDNIEGKWTKISWQGKTGWVFGGFLSTSEPASSESTSKSSTTEDASQCRAKCEENYKVQLEICRNGQLCGRQGTDCDAEFEHCRAEPLKWNNACIAECH